MINGWLVPGGIYLALASGAGNPIRCHESSCEFSALYAVISVFLFLIALIIWKSIRLVAPQLILGIGFLMVFAVIGYFSPLPYFVGSKAWGGLFASGFIIFFMAHLVLHVGTSGLALGLVRVIFFAFIITFLFKASVGGIMDRDTPYLLNGPIIFGWLMGLGGLCAAYLYFFERKLMMLFFCIVLSIGVFWSGSKGPIIAYAISMFFLYFFVGGFAFAKLKIVLVIIFLVVLLGVWFLDFQNFLSASRFGLLVDIYENGINYSEGSVGVRLAAVKFAFSLFQESPFLGIGPGGFAEYDSILMYPHNIHLEILLEYGLLVFLPYIFLVGFGLLNGSILIRSLVLFFVICMSFSGDFSYFRYLLPFLLLSIMSIRLRAMGAGCAKNLTFLRSSR
jgi:O-antigen ligase